MLGFSSDKTVGKAVKIADRVPPASGPSLLAPPSRPAGAPTSAAAISLPGALPASGFVKPSGPGAEPARGGSVIGKELSISGQHLTITSKGLLQVDGEIQGDLHCVALIVSEQARITGTVIADTVVVHGHVIGTIRGNHVALQSTARVEGDISHQALTMEHGAQFDGRSRRSAEPKTTVVSPDHSAPGTEPGSGPHAATLFPPHG